jgi:choline dehydrogenase
MQEFKMANGAFTHIVVGAGSAGCVVAARISENPNFNVLLIEAGPDCNPKDPDVPKGIQNARKVPMKGQSKIFDDRVDWNLLVDLPDGGSFTVPQAKIVGGGSSINGGTALRNTRNDCQEWVSLGNEAWDYQSVYDVYQSLENDEVRGTRGPHPIERARIEDCGKIQTAFVEAGLSSGFNEVFDLNEPGAEGVGPSPICRRGDVRISASNTFIDPIRRRRNFTIHPGKWVDRVIFDNERATGVIMVDGEEVFASKEVIICAGAVFSPAILQRSGVGPQQLLKSLNLPCVADLPVGANLSDHVCIPLVAKPRDGAYLQDDYSLLMQARWSSSLHPGWTDLQLICFSYLEAAPPEPGVQQRTLCGTATGHVAGIGCNLNKTSSLGSIRIKSIDPTEAPVVAPNYLQTAHDQAIAREVVRRAYGVITSDRMQKVLYQPIGLDESVIASDRLLDVWVQNQYSTTYHFTGTCKMASRDKGGVVDQNGRVYGVTGLRVCDASIIPTSPAANTMWTTMMFADRIGISIRDGKDVRRLDRIVSLL